MFETILVPLDGSALAERAVPYAARLARLTGAGLLLLRAVPDNADDVLVQAAEAMLATTAEQLRAAGLHAQARVVSGDAARVILEVAAADGVGMIVMSTHGQSGPSRWLFGSVADEVLRQTVVPVLLVPAAVAAPWPEDRPLRILVPLDGSDSADAVVRVVDNLARGGAADILLLRVAEQHGSRYGWAFLATELDEARAYLARVADALRRDGLSVSTRAEVGSPAPTIAATAREQDADLIAMATRGRGGLARLVLGSVTTGTIERSNVPVLVVRPSSVETATGTPVAEEIPGRVSVPTADVALTLGELDLVVRGLGELVYEPGHERPVVEAAWELLSRLKRAESALYESPVGQGDQPSDRPMGRNARPGHASGAGTPAASPAGPSKEQARAVE